MEGLLEFKSELKARMFLPEDRDEMNWKKGGAHTHLTITIVPYKTKFGLKCINGTITLDHIDWSCRFPRVFSVLKPAPTHALVGIRGPVRGKARTNGPGGGQLCSPLRGYNPPGP